MTGETPINWIHLSDDRKKIIVTDSTAAPPGLVIFVIESQDNGLYYTATEGTGTHPDNDDIPNFPGPLTMAIPIYDLTPDNIREVTSQGMQATLSSLYTVFQREIETQGWEDEAEFTVETLDEELIVKHPDAVTGVLVTDGESEDARPLYRVWAMLYHWTDQDGKMVWR